MKMRFLWWTLLLCLAVAANACFAADNPLRAAGEAFDQGLYDKGIGILAPVAEREPQNYGVLELLAVGYHWKKDYPHALKYYDLAEKARGTLSSSKIALLYEVGRYDDVIRDSADAARKGNLQDVAVMGALISSYMAKNRPEDAAEFIAILRGRNYQTQYDQDYRTYILAYYALWRGDADTCRDLLRRISSGNLREYARNDPRFEPLWNDPAFSEIVKRTNP
ncbi:MAG TPA: hypothetical protein VI298_17315 [Geobacteraceae bacterium]